MVFAVEEINQNMTLLPGVNLGYRILDSCARYPWALQGAMSLVGGDTHSCNSTKPVPLLIAAATSTTGIILSRILGPLSVPVISYFASCPCLSDRIKYPNFFRTIPSDVYQAQALAQLAIRFHWTWVGAVIENNDYGRLAIQVFQEEVRGKGVCLDFIETVRRETVVRDVRRAALTIQASTARVILIFCWYTEVRKLLQELARINVTDRQFLASEAWSTSEDLLQDLTISKVASGVLGVAIRSSAIPRFEKFLRSLHPSHRPTDVFLREFWQKEFGCNPLSTDSFKSLLKSLLPPCSGKESLQNMQRPFTDTSLLRVSYNVYLAIYAAAHALHSLLSCPGRDRSTRNNRSTCSSPKHIKPIELLQHLNKVNVTTPHGESFYFQGADIPAKYDLVNWQKTPGGPLKLVLVGLVDGFEPHLNQSAVQWSTGSSQVPVSLCSESCPPGTRKANRKGEPLCCFDCIPCTEGEISNTTGSLHCERCSSEFWSNAERTACIPRQLDFLSFNETLGITLTTAAVSGAAVTSAVFVVFLYYRHTPMVRANNSELSFLLLVSLKLCFLCSLVFIGRPSVWSCRFQQAAFGISFVLCVSCLLVKTLVVLAVFRSARPGAETLMKWFGPGQQRGSVLLFTCVQVIICATWLALSPPEPRRDLGFRGSKVTLECAMASVVGFSLVLGYIGLLACTCLLLAFLALSTIAASMPGFSWLLALWPSSPLLLMGLMERPLGLRLGLQVVHSLTCSRWGSPDDQGLFQDGDIVLGGLFSLRYRPSATDQDFTQMPYYQSCAGLENLPLQYIYAMVFAMEEINLSTTLLPGVKLGYHIRDSCAIHPWATQAAMSLVGGDSSSCNATFLTNYSAMNEEKIRKRSGDKPVPLIIGGSSSVAAKVLSKILEPLYMSYTASCPCLSDRTQYPNFFRTMPSDIYQARAIAQLAIRFKWTWIGAVVANNDYGHMAVKIFQEETQGKEVCLAFIETLQRERIVSDSRRAALTIQASTARVILVFSWYTDVRELFIQLSKINVTDRQFLASEAWSTSSNLLQNPVTSEVARGVLGVAIRSSSIPGFHNFLRSLSPSKRPDDKFLREFWEKEFGCSPNVTPQSPFHKNRLFLKASLPPCSGTESLQSVQNHFTDTSQLRVTYNVYLAVYAAAHALHSLLSCPDNKNSTCFILKHIKPIELLQQMSSVNFTTPQGDLLYFQGGDVPAKYDLLNWQKTPEGPLKMALIGRVDGFDIHLNESAIQWSTGSNQVPVSVCSESCPPGTRKANRKGEPLCCFDCIPCAEGEISNTTGSLHCERCPPDFWSNVEQTVCIPRQLDFLSFNETLGITLTTAAVSGAVVTSAVFVVFVYYRHTPMVRANNSELSFLLLVSLKLCFLCSLVFIGRPSVWSCRFQQAAFGISFVLCVSCLQVKTIVVLAAFRSARPGAEALMKWFGPGQQRGSVCVFTSIQVRVIICVIWLSLSPPVPQADLKVPGVTVTLKCAMASVVGFSLVLGYIGLLACTSLLLAFLARKLPDNFNEAKLITFSMLIFCAVWVAFVPAYVSSPGKFSVAVEIFAILASSYGLLLCIFAPKCFIILLRPEKNTKKHLMSR
ncbi:extracellular calcium-sensing receptor-like [Notolabrus celidotus]|uniref:extracellular calcium-sensing receptor-like n=1 Tax=Notolabrus celidotus TaxID=1203425 RepID=UPI00148FF84E|nr:extracellular calcium-sensing receptor-like [Notolabrus celidotus]